MIVVMICSKSENADTDRLSAVCCRRVAAIRENFEELRQQAEHEPHPSHSQPATSAARCGTFFHSFIGESYYGVCWQGQRLRDPAEA